MQISAIGNSYDAKCQYSRHQTFKNLIVDKSARPIIKNMPKKDFLEFKQLRRRLANTKHWDMKISGRGNNSKQLKFEFIDKTNQHGIITDGIYPYQKTGDTIKVYSIIYGEENLSNNLIESLKFKSAQRADEVYNKYMQNMEMLRYQRYSTSQIENMKSKEIELKMLEEASENANISEKPNVVSTKISTKAFIGNDL